MLTTVLTSFRSGYFFPKRGALEVALHKSLTEALNTL